MTLVPWPMPKLFEKYLISQQNENYSDISYFVSTDLKLALIDLMGESIFETITSV